jgi:cell division transport system permease protein
MTDGLKRAALRLRRVEAAQDEPLQAGPEFRVQSELVPRASIAGRSLVTVIAILTLLAALAACLSLLLSDASRDWRSAVSQEMTVQVRPVAARDIEADVAAVVKAAKATTGVADASAMDKKSSEALLEPWLGKLDLSELPVPRLIVIRLDPAAALDLAGFRAALRAAAPTATLDDHRFWLERLARMADALTFAASAVFALILVATGMAVAFATRGAMAGAREIVDVLHMVGASDGYIAAQVQRHFFRLGAKGAALGGAAALIAIWIARVAMRATAEAATEQQFDLLFGSFQLGWRGVAAAAAVALGVAALTGMVSRWIVMRRLRGAE